MRDTERERWKERDKESETERCRPRNTEAKRCGEMERLRKTETE